MSNYLNPKFKFNITLIAENFYINNNYSQSKIVIESFDEDDGIYYWYKIKKKHSNYFERVWNRAIFKLFKIKFKKIKYPSEKIFFDMANLSKSFKRYDEAISYYNRILTKLNKNSLIYADVLYRRGGGFERLGDFVKADRDLLKSLEINPDDAYVLNYLAYSWLETKL